MSMLASSVSERTVLIAGATSASGEAVAAALVAAGATVVATGRDDHKLATLAERVPGIVTSRVDLGDEDAVAALRDELHASVGPIDGIVHLVGGWRGGGGLAGQSDDDFRFLETSLTALRHVTRTFDDDIAASDAGRVVMISSTAVARPLAGGANYAALKAAAEAWMQAVAHGFAKRARDAGEPLTSSATVYRVKALDGLEGTFADAVVELWREDAAALNGAVRTLTEGDK